MVIVAALAAGRAVAAPAPPKLTKIDAAPALAKLLGGMPLDHYEIGGKLTLPSTVDAPFECTNCTFDGPVNARDTIFKRTVNLRGSEFMGPVDMRGAEFDKPALFSLGAIFDQRADFSLATFEDTAGFDTTDFSGPAMFQLARFQDTADFGRASVELASVFSGAQFTKAGLFIDTTFGAPTRFDHASGAAIDFTYATLPDKTDLESVTAGTLSLHQSVFLASTQLNMNNLVVTSLIMDPADTRYVNTEARGQVLDLIQSSAKARNDLGVANDAYYRIRARRGNTWGWFGHAVDVVFYRGVAGYLVVPWRPLFWLLVLALIVAFWRSRRAPVAGPAEYDWIPDEPRQAAPPRRIVPARLYRWGHELLDTFALIVPRFGGPPSGRRFETFVYRILLVCVLFGFANSNPTLRQMLDAIL